MARVAIVCTSPLLAQGLAAVLAVNPALQVEQQDLIDHSPATATALAKLADLVVAHAPDALTALAAYTAFAPYCSMVLIGDDLREVAARHNGCSRPIGLLGGNPSSEQLRCAVDGVLHGLRVLDPRHHHGGGFSRESFAQDREPLTPRELEVFELLAKGLSNRDIGCALEISTHTAKFHVGQILAKVGAATRAEAVLIGMQLGLIGA